MPMFVGFACTFSLTTLQKPEEVSKTMPKPEHVSHKPKQSCGGLGIVRLRIFLGGNPSGQEVSTKQSLHVKTLQTPSMRVQWV